MFDSAGRPYTSLAALARSAYVPSEARERLFQWRRAYLGRYLRIGPGEIDRMPVSMLNGYMEALKEIFEAEAPKGSFERRAEQDFT